MPRAAVRQLVAMFAAVLALAASAAAARADVLVDESFAGPTSAAPLRVGGSFVPCLTASTDVSQANVAGCAPGQPSIPPGGDPPGSGTLRLTDNGHDRSGFAIYRHVFPFTSGLRMTFTSFAYNGTRVPGYGAADGISVFFTDGSVGADRPGAFGGSLGYAQKSIDFDATVPDLPGIPGGFLGVGVDEFGNYANDREARGYGCANRVDRNIHPNYITLRGPGELGSGWLRGYCVLDRAPAPAPGVLDQPDAISRTAPSVAHTFRVEVDPLGQADGTPNPNAHVRVFADMTNNGTFVPVLDAPLAPNPPATFEFGFGSSTGQGTNVHELRALRVETVASLPRYTLSKRQPAPMHAGQRGVFDLQATLAADGGVAYAPVTLHDPLPAGMTVAEPPRGTGWDCSATIVGTDTVDCTHPASLEHPIRPGTALPPLSVTVQLAPDIADHVVNRAELDGPEILTPVIAEDPVDVVRSVDVAVRKTASPARVAAGDPTSFVLIATNNGPGDARDVIVTDQLPPALTVTAVHVTVGTCTQTLTTVRCALGTLAAGASAQVTVDVSSPAGLAAQTVRNDAVVQTTDPDTDPANDRASAPVEIVGPGEPDQPVSAADIRLTVDKHASSPRARVGSTVGYTIHVHNAGPTTAHDARLVDTLSIAHTVNRIAAAGGSCVRLVGAFTCRFGDLASGATTTVTARVTFLRSGQAINVASVLPSAGPLTDRAARADVAVVGGTALRIAKTADHARVNVGDRIRYRIAVRSLGPDPATGVLVCDRLPRALHLVAAPHSTTRRGRLVCWTIPSIAAGSTRTFALTAQAIAPSDAARNLASARAVGVAAVRALRSVAIRPVPPPPGLG
ncbi:hypothetical protein DSM104299_05482 [Baekduia alba]|uniref:hypothetical protein n=1 Tax=Baekduia alba TaxID=2997333 RepID=UPI00234195F7|nr:hypothetical protein [Baekduia alba]WCB96716.1 hypothetical protein DSM104299_05482 [Baekduia alba]